MQMKLAIGLMALAVIVGGGYWLLMDSGNVQSKVDSVTPGPVDVSFDTDGDVTAGQAIAPVEMIASSSASTSTENNKKIMTATLHTSKGDITIEFNPATPNTVANFVKLAESGFYGGTKFHRVIKGFMSQGGDPLSKDDSKMNMWGSGGPGYKFADEIGPDNRNDVGTISMANAGPNTNGSQFFINAADNAFLDGKHTVFGKITAGLDVAAAINAVNTGANDRPVEEIVIKGVTLK